MKASSFQFVLLCCLATSWVLSQTSDCPLACENGGTCVENPNNSYSCNCTTAYDGVNAYAGLLCEFPSTVSCEEGVDVSTFAFCVNNGDCRAIAPQGTEFIGCNCPASISGPHCEFIDSMMVPSAAPSSLGGPTATTAPVQVSGAPISTTAAPVKVSGAPISATTIAPTPMTTIGASDVPSDVPSGAPSVRPSMLTTTAPSVTPVAATTGTPSAMSQAPISGGGVNSDMPSLVPSDVPSVVPSIVPSGIPAPVAVPVAAPVVPVTARPTFSAFSPSAQKFCPGSTFSCYNGGQCVKTRNNGYICNCTAAFDGFHAFAGFQCEYGSTSVCEQNVTGSSYAFCTNNGVCNKVVATGQPHAGCSCPASIFGEHCEYLDSAALPSAAPSASLQSAATRPSSFTTTAMAGILTTLLLFARRF